MRFLMVWFAHRNLLDEPILARETLSNISIPENQYLLGYIRGHLDISQVRGELLPSQRAVSRSVAMCVRLLRDIKCLRS
jgi:hypothetical protein